MHDVDLIIEGFFEVTIGDDEFLINFFDGYFAALVAGGFVDLAEGALAQAVALIEGVVADLFDYVHVC